MSLPQTPTSTRRNVPRNRSTSRRRSVGQGVAYKGQARDIVNNVREYFQYERDNGDRILPVINVIDRTVEATRVSRSTVLRMKKEKEANQPLNSDETVLLETPGKIHPNYHPWVTKLDSFQEEAIRNHIYGYYMRRDRPTVLKLHSSLEEAGLFEGSTGSLHSVLKKLGFRYKTMNGRKLLMERHDIVLLRIRFLQSILHPSVNFEDIVWLDETWVNAGHSLSHGWTDDSIRGTMPAPSGKGGRLILLHAGTSLGFIPDALDLFRSKKTGDYHEEMNHEHFIEWFEHKLLAVLEEPSVIVMDNAPYHSKIIDRAPTAANKKEEIIEWLRNHEIPMNESMFKTELLDLVRMHKPSIPRYEVDELAERMGHRVIRLPPYHCHFNPIELVWSHIKHHVAKNNRTFTMTEVEALTREGIDKVTAEQWRRDVQHTKRVIQDAFARDVVVEQAMEQFIINVSEGARGSELSDDDTDSDTENADL